MPEKKLSKADKEFIQRHWKVGAFDSSKIFAQNKRTMLKKLSMMGVIKKTPGTHKYEIDRVRFMEVDKSEEQGSLF